MNPTSTTRSREAYAREHGLSAPLMVAAVAHKRRLLDLYNVKWVTPRLPSTEYYYTRAMSISKEIKQGKDPEGFYK